MLDPNHRVGAMIELRALAWLVERGYMVFHNICSHGPIDVVAIKDNETLRLDAKSVWAYLTPKQYALGVGTITPDKKGGFIIRTDFSQKGKRGRPPGSKNKNPMVKKKHRTTNSIFDRQTELMRAIGF